MTEFNYTLTGVKLNDVTLDRMLNSTPGEVGRHLRAIGLYVLTGARTLAGSRTGKLRASLYMRQGRFARGQYVEVGSPLDYAYYHHEGTRPYVIRAKGSRVLTFTVGGRRVYARSVTHPRTRGAHFLTIPLRRALR